MNRIEFIKLEKENNKSAVTSLPYQAQINLSGWTLTQDISEFEILKIRNKINDLLGLSKISDTFNLSINDSEIIMDFHKKNNICCNTCTMKFIECDKCVLICQSPLERDLLLALKSVGLDSSLQQRINKDGKIYDNSSEIDKEQILTIPDFYLAKGSKKFCIYTDGHTYHERTEYQASRDRNIDRELQILGFEALRYTGKEIREQLIEKTQHIYEYVTSSKLTDEQLSALKGMVKNIQIKNQKA